MADFIGSTPFFRLYGWPDAIQLEMEPITRPGMDGVAYRALGYRAKPFEIHSIVDVVGWNSAVALLNIYKTAVGNVYSIFINGTEFDTFLVLDVKAHQPRAVANATGGLNAGNVIVEADWQLIYAGT